MEEKVGYGNPPEKGKWKPGQVTNPEGRPKGSRNRSTVIKELFAMVIDLPPGKVRDYCEKLGLPIKGDIETLLTAVMLAKGLTGNPERVYKELNDSAHGQAKQQQEISIQQIETIVPGEEKE